MISLDDVCPPQPFLSTDSFHYQRRPFLTIYDTHTHTQVLASNGRGGGMYVNPLERVSSLHNSQPSTINNQPSTINNQQSTINNQQSTINNQHKHLSFILLSAGRPLCLFLHLLLSSQNPHRRQAQEVAGRSLLIKCVVTNRARRDSW